MVWLSFFAGTGLSFFVLVLVALVLPEKKRKESEKKADAFHDELLLHWEDAGRLSVVRNKTLGRIAGAVEEYTQQPKKEQNYDRSKSISRADSVRRRTSPD